MKYLGTIELTPENDGVPEPVIWEICQEGRNLLIGTACNVGFLQTYSMEMEDWESIDEALCELVDELRVEAIDGVKYCNRIK